MYVSNAHVGVSKCERIRVGACVRGCVYGCVRSYMCAYMCKYACRFVCVRAGVYV
jgi:hypothetical protein